MATTLELVLLYLVAAVLGVVVCRLMKLPPMLGYLVVGVLIGPNALALAQDSAGVKYLAEFGVVFLMFVIGLEFNLPKLRSMRTLVFGLGLSQVVLTIAGALGGHFVLVASYEWLTGRQWQMSWQGAVVLGSAIAMSSTAIVVKLMAERLELESEHGRRVIGVLLFQDLAVVPLLVLIPALGTGGEQMLTGGVLLLPPPEWRLSENPLGLFMAVDALVALLSLLGAPRQPGLRLEAGAVLALLAVPALGVMVAWRVLGLGEAFVSGNATLSEDRALVSVDVGVRGDMAGAGMRQRAQQWAMTLHDPAMKMGTEVAELRFAGPRSGAAAAVLCLYEDGTPARWLPAQGDCLQGYTTFASRLARHAATLPPDAPREVREHLAARAACAEIGWKSAHPISPMTYSADEACMDLQRRGELLAKRHPQLR